MLFVGVASAAVGAGGSSAPLAQGRRPGRGISVELCGDDWIVSRSGCDTGIGDGGGEAGAGGMGELEELAW